jgi:hypothetical protein
VTNVTACPEQIVRLVQPKHDFGVRFEVVAPEAHEIGNKDVPGQVGTEHVDQANPEALPLGG